MAVANSIGVRTTADHPGRIAPVSTLSAADRAAHDEASHIRGSRPARSNLAVCPDCNQPVSGAHHQCPRRAGFSPAGEEALHRAYAATERIRRDEYTAALNQRGLNEYQEYVQGVAA